MFVTSGKASLAYDVHGAPHDNRDVLLIHAGVTDRRSWRPLIAAIGGDRRIVSYDERGYGETTYEQETYAGHDDAIAVMDAAGLDTAVVVGASSGGRTALDLALEHPDRVSALVLIAPAVSGAPRAESYPEPLASLDAAVDAADDRGDLAEVNRLEAHIWLDGPTASEGRVGGRVRELFLAMNERALAAPDPGDEPRSVDAWNRLEELAMPLLVLVGRLDLLNFQERSRVLVERVKGARLVELDGTAHLPHLESQASCLTAIAEFLEQQDAIRPTR